MECTRCAGMMVVDHYVDIAGSSMLVRTWRCINCGAVVDPLINHNRQLQKSGAYPVSTELGQEEETEMV